MTRPTALVLFARLVLVLTPCAAPHAAGSQAPHTQTGAQAVAEIPVEITEQRVRAAWDDACAAVAAELAFAPEPPLTLVLATPAEVAARVAAENLPAVRRRQADAARAETEAQALGEAIGRFAFAKYAWSTREVLVVPSTLAETAQTLARPELSSDTALRAILVHELVHARDDAAHDFAARLAEHHTLDALTGLNAVLEGHAQHLARRVCAQRGWAQGFEAYSAAIGALPEEGALERLGEAMRLLLGVQSANLRTAYHEGERFVAALETAGGAELVARAFREPPRDGETIFHPEWYVDPSLRPRVLYDAEPVLDLFAARLPEDEWSAQRLSLEPAQLAASLALLPAETVQRITETLRASRLIVLQPSAAPDSKMVVLGVLEFASAAAARDYVDAARSLVDIKAERMKTGALRILASERNELELPGLEGFVARLRMQNGLLPLEVVTLDAARGSVVLEAIFSAEPIDDDDLAALAPVLFEALRPLATGPR